MDIFIKLIVVTFLAFFLHLMWKIGGIELFACGGGAILIWELWEVKISIDKKDNLK
jgi:hypothetical protein